ncbi:MAG: acylphosphatase [Methanolobus sp.]
MQDDKPNSEKLAAATIFFTGKVPGGDFNKYAIENADHLSLTGYGETLPDGWFKIYAEGEKSSVQSLIGYLEMSSAFHKVDHVQVAWSDYKGQYSGFSIKE